MLIYSSYMTLQPKGGSNDIIDQIAKWWGKKSHDFVDPAKLSQGVRRQLKDGSVIESRAVLDQEGNNAYPYMFSFRLSHADSDVSGRRWVTEVGLHQDTPDAQIKCTFLVKTDEISAKVTAPITVTRPLVVLELSKTCNPAPDTPGMRNKTLDEVSAELFLMEIERAERIHPIVVVSASRDGTYPVAPDELRSKLIGLADVVIIPPTADTYLIESIIGPHYSVWGGAINIVFPIRRREQGITYDTLRFLPLEISKIVGSEKKVDTEILSAVTHRTNLPNSWKHISIESVDQAILQRHLKQVIDNIKKGNDTHEYVALLEEADKELKKKENELTSLQVDVEERDHEIIKLQNAIDSLKYNLSEKQTSLPPVGASEDELSGLKPLKDAITSLLDDNMNLEQALTTVKALYPNRLVVLDSAYESARESSEFKDGRKAFELLLKLADGYWSALADGHGDMIAKKVFGKNSYAQNEGESLSKEGRRRRVFSYRGRDMEMNKHLKIGRKESVDETLRIHFEWVANEKKIIIGHCGKHLNF